VAALSGDDAGGAIKARVVFSSLARHEEAIVASITSGAAWTIQKELSSPSSV
jgi:hypothetical protein